MKKNRRITATPHEDADLFSYLLADIPMATFENFPVHKMGFGARVIKGLFWGLGFIISIQGIWNLPAFWSTAAKRLGSISDQGVWLVHHVGVALNVLCHRSCKHTSKPRSQMERMQDRTNPESPKYPLSQESLLDPKTPKILKPRTTSETPY